VSNRSDHRLYLLGSETLHHYIDHKWDSGFTVRDLRSPDDAANECAEHGHEWHTDFWFDPYAEEQRSCRRCRTTEKRRPDHPRVLSNGQVEQGRKNEEFLTESWGTQTFQLVEYGGWTPTEMICAEARIRRPATGINNRLRESVEYVLESDRVTALPCRKATGCLDPDCERWWLRSRYWVYMIEPDGEIFEVSVSPEQKVLYVGEPRLLRLSAQDLVTVEEAGRVCAVSGHHWQYNPVHVELENCRSCGESRQKPRN
jgi:hypothetical protein